MTENEIATKIIGVCINIHKNLGPGSLCTDINLSKIVR